MKICTDCAFSERAVIDTPMGVQNGLVCTHEECRDPVEGSAIPCNFARREMVFCSITAKYFKPKEDVEDAQIISLVKP